MRGRGSAQNTSRFSARAMGGDGIGNAVVDIRGLIKLVPGFGIRDSSQFV